MYQQQGDVLIWSGRKPKGTLKALPHKVLAEGEVTGHKHEVIGEGTLYLDKKGELWLHARKAVQLVHPEHGAQTIRRGWRHVTRKREYDHFAEEARSVQD